MFINLSPSKHSEAPAGQALHWAWGPWSHAQARVLVGGPGCGGHGRGSQLWGKTQCPSCQHSSSERSHDAPAVPGTQEFTIQIKASPCAPPPCVCGGPWSQSWHSGSPVLPRALHREPSWAGTPKGDSFRAKGSAPRHPISALLFMWIRPDTAGCCGVPLLLGTWGQLDWALRLAGSS